IIIQFDYPFYRGIVFESAGCNRCFFIFNYTKRASPEKSLLSLVKLFNLGTYGTAPQRKKLLNMTTTETDWIKQFTITELLVIQI
ncbi:hypothetical protein, partial [Liquorilactobacillus mali]|uniref:hypothetical protein n=1 Tax=Liquorilactobacillus mali TaxID=1618 RepID=UPI0029530FA9